MDLVEYAKLRAAHKAAKQKLRAAENLRSAPWALGFAMGVSAVLMGLAAFLMFPVAIVVFSQHNPSQATRDLQGMICAIMIFMVVALLSIIFALVTWWQTLEPVCVKAIGNGFDANANANVNAPLLAAATAGCKTD